MGDGSFEHHAIPSVLRCRYYYPKELRVRFVQGANSFGVSKECAVPAKGGQGVGCTIHCALQTLRENTVVKKAW